ncbi:NHL repeat-containing protein [Haliovirga abyssi]|uniref:6-bladed beta-propeller n=1 Tax=Haliovirga abyssi TaxID=2996794 RepID=A0AAU9DWR3_9FUSO|nr:NHL repeat-containing protein [Haliovirga abyssi]BDU50761.1 hypothetical protein HLVA_13300 [Haliovirga abyssi]
MKKTIFYLIIILSSITFSQEFFVKKELSTRFFPVSVAVDKFENAYVVDGITHSVKKFNSKGKYLFSFGIKQTGGKNYKEGGVYPSPVDLFVKGNKVYLLDTNNGIYIFDLKGKLLKEIDLKAGKLLGEIERPKAIYVSDKKIYIADTDNNRVEIFNLEGEAIRDFGYKSVTVGGMIQPQGITKLNGDIIVSDSGNNRVMIYDENGIFKGSLYGKSKELDLSYKAPLDIFADTAGEIFVVDNGNQRIQVFNKNYKILLLFGERGDKPTQFRDANDIWVTDNYIYVTDGANKSVKVFNKDFTYIRSIGKNVFQDIFISTLLILTSIFIVVSILIKRVTARRRKWKEEE